MNVEHRTEDAPMSNTNVIYQACWHSDTARAWEDVSHQVYDALQPSVATRRILYTNPIEDVSDVDVFDVAPNFRGYAHLGVGRYVLMHTGAGDVPELCIVPATEDERANRVVGDLWDGGTDEVPAERIAVRLSFENVEGLDALEQQLRLLRDEHFGGGGHHRDDAPPTTSTAMFLLDREYLTRGGDRVKLVSIHNAGTDYETMACAEGVHRYTRRLHPLNFGRVTGTNGHDPRDLIHPAASASS